MTSSLLSPPLPFVILSSQLFVDATFKIDKMGERRLKSIHHQNVQAAKLLVFVDDNTALLDQEDSPYQEQKRIA
jgi:hypothetical protein